MDKGYKASGTQQELNERELTVTGTASDPTAPQFTFFLMSNRNPKFHRHLE